MKKTLLITILILILPALCFAGAVQKKQCSVIEKKNAGAGCNPGIGDNTVRATENHIANGEMDCMLYAASCSGTFGTAHLHMHNDGTDSDCKVCIYSYDSDAPDDGDLKVGCTSANDNIATTEDWATLTGKIGGSASYGTTYFVCVLGGTSGCSYHYASSGGSRVLYYDTGFTYATPPNDLTGTWDATAAARESSVYVEIE